MESRTQWNPARRPTVLAFAEETGATVMKIKALGHVVLKVSDRGRAEAFYNGVLGLPVIARFDQEGAPRMAFFSLGNHHDFAVMEIPGAAKADAGAVGLAHV